MGNYLNDYQAYTGETLVNEKVIGAGFLALGLCEESGELVAAVNDLCLHRVGAESHRIITEAGDVLWNVARILDSHDTPLADAYRRVQYTGNATLPAAAHTALYEACSVAGRVKKFMRDYDEWTETDRVEHERGVLDSMVVIIGAIEALARALGSSILGVMQTNRAKINRRVSSGTIQGSGDR